MTKRNATTETTTTTEPTMTELLALIQATNANVERLAAAVADSVEASPNPKTVPTPVEMAQPERVPTVALDALKQFVKDQGRSAAGTWSASRILRESKAYRKANGTAKSNDSRFQASVPSTSTKSGRFEMFKAERTGRGRIPSREDAPGLLANHPYRDLMLAVTADDWLALASHGAGHRVDKSTGRVIRKGLPNPTGMTGNWRVIAKTMSGQAPDGEGGFKPRTPNVMYEACNLVQHLHENGKL